MMMMMMMMMMMRAMYLIGFLLRSQGKTQKNVSDQFSTRKDFVPSQLVAVRQRERPVD